MKKTINLLLILFATAYINTVFAQQIQPEIPRYTKVETGYLMVLRQGDNIIQELEKLAVIENIPSANFTGMGFVNMTFGFYDFEAKKFNPKEFKDVEMASMHGTIAWQEGKPSIHAHGTVTDSTFRAYGGHILLGIVSTGSAEIFIIVHDKKFERIKEKALGANVLCIGNCDKVN